MTPQHVVPGARGWLRNLAEKAYEQAVRQNERNLLATIIPMPGARLLDLGCDDGLLTVKLGARLETNAILGVEVVKERALLAANRGVEVQLADLTIPLPFTSQSFDVVCSNQVIEHVSDTDLFVQEAYRLLRPGGYAVTSTENLASWPNVASLLFGWQPFSLTNVSHRHLGLGNPLALHRAQESQFKSWEHMRVFAYRGLSELFTVHGFEVEHILGAGYLPFLGRIARIDPRHAMFLTVKARKPSTGEVSASDRSRRVH